MQKIVRQECGPSWGQIERYDQTCYAKVIQNDWTTVALGIVLLAVSILSILSAVGYLNLGVGAYALYSITGLSFVLLIIKGLLLCREVISIKNQIKAEFLRTQVNTQSL